MQEGLSLSEFRESGSMLSQCVYEIREGAVFILKFMFCILKAATLWLLLEAASLSKTSMFL